MRMMKHSLLIVKRGLLASLMVYLFGCSQSFEIFGYKSEEVNYDWGTLGARLIGNRVETGSKVVRKSPYELFIWFSSNTSVETAVKIEKIEIRYSEDNQSIYSENSYPEKKLQKQKESYDAYFSIPNLKFEYRDIVCDIQFTIKAATQQRKYRTKIPLRTDFKKYKHIESH